MPVCLYVCMHLTAVLTLHHHLPLVYLAFQLNLEVPTAELLDAVSQLSDALEAKVWAASFCLSA